MSRAMTAENGVYNVVMSLTTMTPVRIVLESIEKVKAIRERVTLRERESIGIYEPKRIPVNKIKKRAKKAMKKLNNGEAARLIALIKSRMPTKVTYLYEIADEYQNSFRNYVTLLRAKPVKQVRFKDVHQEHIDYLGQLLSEPRTRHSSLRRKSVLMMRRFPGLSIGKDTVRKMQR